MSGDETQSPPLAAVEPLPPTTFLIVDDDRVLRDRLARAFRDRGHEVETAAGLADAQEVAARFRPRRAVGQAVRALVKNAIEASPGAGGVSIAARLDGSHWRIEVRDHGHGMGGEILERAMEPFFTTKAPGKGMGLGLFLARDVIERVGGTLAIRSEPGAGTTATVLLPAGAQARPERPAPARSAA